MSSGQLQRHQPRQQQRKLSKTQRDIHQWSTKINISVIFDHSGSEWEESDSIGGVVCLWQCSGRGSGVSASGVKGVFAHSGQVLLAEPEERRSFMDIRLLLARGDIGEAKSLPFTCIAGLSASWLSRHEPVGEGWGGGRRKDRSEHHDSRSFTR